MNPLFYMPEYDDMGTHITTSFIYSVSTDGKIYDHTMSSYVN